MHPIKLIINLENKDKIRLWISESMTKNWKELKEICETTYIGNEKLISINEDILEFMGYKSTSNEEEKPWDKIIAQLEKWKSLVVEIEGEEVKEKMLKSMTMKRNVYNSNRKKTIMYFVLQ